MMECKILDGKKVASEVRERIAVMVKEIRESGKVPPGLAVVLVGDNPASKVYVGQKEKACKEVGFESFLYHLPEATTQEELLNLVGQLNEDPNVHGILVQLPLPKHLNETEVIEAIRPEKDVDGFHPMNLGKLVAGLPCTVPCTPKGIMHLLEYYGIEIEGKNAVVVGRSNIVGKPVAHLLLQKNATVTICHSRTRNLEDITKEADILVVAAGKPHFVTQHMVKRGAVVVDVGINRLESGLVGDVDFDGVRLRASWITPVPGGVGPMTIAMLLENTLEMYERFS